ncbi:MAG: putative toxin-antitoxin system toxin component, PIN family [Planctomycetota bacterium]
MRLVLDTNVLVAAFISHGVCHELLEHCALRHEIILSEPILAEFERILVEKFGFGPTEIRQAVRLLRSRAAMVTPARLAAPVSRDSDDDVVLATALVGGCDGVVSGDRDLSDLESYQGMRIMTPTQFWAFEKDEPEGSGS